MRTMTDVNATADQAAPIIEARALEKFYAQPDGRRIQVIVPIDLAIYPEKMAGSATNAHVCALVTSPKAL